MDKGLNIKSCSGLILNSWSEKGLKAIRPEQRALVLENQIVYGNISKGIKAKTRGNEGNCLCCLSVISGLKGATTGFSKLLHQKHIYNSSPPLDNSIQSEAEFQFPHTSYFQDGRVLCKFQF